MSDRNPNRHGKRRLTRLLVPFALVLATLPAGPAVAATVGAQQVMIQVRVASVARTALRELGVDWQGSSFQVGERGFGNLPGLETLLEGDASRTLARPSAMTNTGNLASFEIGGDPGELRDVALRLNVVPDVSSGRGIELGVVLRIDALPVAAGQPAIAPRRVETTQRVENGGSLLIGGVFDPPGPWFGDLPLVGSLFRKPQASDRTELLVIVTPWIVDPNRSGSSASRVPPQIFRHRPDPDVAAPPNVPNQNPKQPTVPSYPNGPSDRLQP